MNLKLLSEVSKLVKGKSPERFAYNGQPKTDCLVDAAKLYSKTDKPAVMGDLKQLLASGLIYFQMQKVGITAAGLVVLAAGKDKDKGDK